MFKKGPDIDKKKLLAKASDVKKDSLTRLKHFNTIIEHSDFNEKHSLFKSHFSFIYHTFIDTFSTFDCNSKQRRDDLECILFIFEQIIIYNPELIKKRWQFYSITFVMQKLLHPNNTWQLRQEGVRLFVLWYQILCDDQNAELKQIFASIVPNVVPMSSIPIASPDTPSQLQQHNAIYQQQSTVGSPSSQMPQLPIKLCNIEALVPKSSNDLAPNNESSFYLDSLLQCMVTQTTKPLWPDEPRKNQELGFSFIFNMFKDIYLQHLFPNIAATPQISHIRATHPSSPPYYMNHSISQYVDEMPEVDAATGQIHGNQSQEPNRRMTSTYQSANTRREHLHLDFRNNQQASHTSSSSMGSPTTGRHIAEQERALSISNYQGIVIKWLTRILRQDMIPGQDELIRSSGNGSVDRRAVPNGQENRDPSSAGQAELDCAGAAADVNNTGIFQGIETSSREMEIARRVIGTWPDNIAIVHELFRRAFLNFHQPASMKRVVNVYKEWICSPNQASSAQVGRNSKLGYTSFNDLLQVFVLNSSNAFLTDVHNATMLDEQFEMCKRIMNIYRYMVMKIYMNTPTWEKLLDVMLIITEQLFPVMPPERKESTIGGRIAPAFFQTFIVSWIRANLYVHISSQMWYKFHSIMRDLVRWRELVEEWSTTMGSLTRVLVKHVYGLSLTDLPLERPQERRRRSKALKSLSTTEAGLKNTPDQNSPTHSTSTTASKQSPAQIQRPPRSGSVRLPSCTQRSQARGLTRSNSDGLMFHQLKLYYSSSISASNQASTPDKMRKIKSEYLILTSELGPICDQSDSVIMTNNDAIDGSSLKDSMLMEHDQTLDSHHSGKSSIDSSSMSFKSSGKKSDMRSASDKCVLLGGSVRGWTSENSVIMWRRMLGLFGNINHIEDPEIHIIAIKCLSLILNDFIKTRENLGISIDNQSSPDQPSLVPPYTFFYGWLLEATHMGPEYSESCSNAYSLICSMTIRRHDIELPQQYLITFYEAIQRGLASQDKNVHASIIQNSTQLLSRELPGCTFLAQGLYDRSRSLLLGSNANQKSTEDNETSLRDPAIQILNSILSLNKPIKKLMVLKSEANNSMNLVAPGDIKAKVFDTLLTCNNRPVVLDSYTRSKSLCSIAIHVYQELCDKSDGLEVERLFDTIMTGLQDAGNAIIFRMDCDLLRLFADHAAYLTHSRPALVSSLIQTVCQLIVRLSTDETRKESIQFLLICLEDWCMAVHKSYLLKPVDQLSTGENDDTLSAGLDDSLLTIVLRSLENVIYDEQYIDDSSNRGTRGSANTSKNSDIISSGHQSHGKSATSSGGSHRDRTMTNNEQHSTRFQHADASVGFNLSNNNKNLESIKMACRVSHLKLITYLGHFPFRQIGPASMSCCVNELDYLTVSDQEASDLKNISGVLMLVLDGNTLMSFVGAPRGENGLCQPVRLIVRNSCGKYAWDASCLESSTFKQSSSGESSEIAPTIFDADSYQEVASRSSAKFDSDFNEDGNSTGSFSSKSSSSRDCIGDLLNHLSCSLASASGQSISSSYHNAQRSKRNTPQSVSNSRYKIAQAEETMIALLTNQRFQELNHCEKSDDTDRRSIAKHSTNLSFGGDKLPDQCSSESRLGRTVSFEQCRQLIQQLGYLSWEKRCKIDSLIKSPRLMRELKNLDAQPSRETHKIAVIYVAPGQEDKNSILINSTGSRAFEDFVSGLGWEVNLTSHLGFKGGLQANKSTGETAPYYCNATTEIMFHVSTRIPVNKPVDDESLNRKLRHLGNDEIHIVWSEHVRDYRRGIIPTEFGDVIIAIYPMLTFQSYYRVQISSKQDVPQFGPLFDNCIVHQASLAPLVRATAVNASRAKRLKLPYFQAHYEERTRLIESIVQNHREKLSFEEFAMQLYTNSELSESQQGSRNQDHQCCA